MSSSIPSWQILTAHAHPFREARDLTFCLKAPLDSLLVWASSAGSGETARMRRLALTFAARIGDKYQIRLTRSIYTIYPSILSPDLLKESVEPRPNSNWVTLIVECPSYIYVIYPSFSDLVGLKKMLEELGQAKTHLELKKMIREVDKTNRGTICYRDFVAMMCGPTTSVLKL